ncbi:hypothetical protein CERSUDRAFT_120720 [Gelatoporia subvermispora B]|uniref:Uncharacterized protein n=1 Tax=Ceriporiopsis subvermispora (strain B) TaxID=914234 RepID=M2RS63_CERS8|nr:hypothetical protein CERSUDRAFT_120720 [Gelatoporia subvermispora B]
MPALAGRTAKVVALRACQHSVIASSMADARKLRPRTPRQSTTKEAASVSGRKRATSVPASGSNGSKRSGWLDCVLVSTPFRKRHAEHAADEPGFFSASQPNPTTAAESISTHRGTARKSRSTRDSAPSSTRKKAAQSTGRGRKRARDPSPTSIRVPSQTSTQAQDDTTHILESRGTGLLTPAPSSILQTHRKSPASQDDRVPETENSSIEDERRREKGKGKLRAQSAGSAAPAIAADVREPAPRPSKRRRLSAAVSPQEAPDGSHSSSVHAEELETREDTSQHMSEDEPSGDFGFQLLDVQDVAALPVISDDPGSALDVSVPSELSLYVPPGVRQLIDNMKQSLRMATVARDKAETRYAAEVQRRVDAERTIAQLTEQNIQLELEARAWTNAVAEAIAPQLSPSLAASPERREGPCPASEQRDPPASSESAPVSQVRSSRAVSELLRESVPVETQDRPLLEIPTSVSAFTNKSLNLSERVAAVQDFLAKLIPMPTTDQT